MKTPGLRVTLRESFPGKRRQWAKARPDRTDSWRLPMTGLQFLQEHLGYTPSSSPHQLKKPQFIHKNKMFKNLGLACTKHRHTNTLSSVITLISPFTQTRGAHCSRAISAATISPTFYFSAGLEEMSQHSHREDEHSKTLQKVHYRRW